MANADVDRCSVGTYENVAPAYPEPEYYTKPRKTQMHQHLAQKPRNAQLSCINNQSMKTHLYVVPYVANKSEAHNSRDCNKLSLTGLLYRVTPR